jgi:hypothetical protein
MSDDIEPAPEHPAARLLPAWAIPAVAGACLTLLVLTLFGPLLFGDRQFAFRDASQVYYPLYLKVQQEWAAGRWPLWMPEANAGTPLLGNPVAAVFYPGKLVYGALPYAWAARVYIVLHVLLAFGSMVVLLRSWGASGGAAAIGALSYAFAAPVLFQWANVIYLVGAAWMPLGICAVDRWLRQGKASGIFELALVLSMQVLGGDLESPYLLGAIGAGYCIGLRCRRPALGGWVLLLALAVAYYAAQLWLTTRVATMPQPETISDSAAMTGYRLAQTAIMVLGWGLFAAIVLRRQSGMLKGMAGLAAAGMLALALSAVQVWPVLEFARRSERAAEIEIDSRDVYAYSTKPIRVLEFLWPNFSGTFDRGNRCWIETFPRRRSEDFWVPSLYMGGLALVLACASAGFRRGPPWRALLSALVVAGVLGSLGEYGSPLFWARHSSATADEPPRSEREPAEGAALVIDPHDGDGGFYWFLSVALPGFGVFRYPGKFLTIVSLGVAGLAAMGWDELGLNNSRRAWWFGAMGLVFSAGALGFDWFGSAVVRAYLKSRTWHAASALGLLDVSGAFADIRAAVVQAVIVLAISLGLFRLARSRHRTAAALGLLLVSLDLLVADWRIIWTVPRSVFERKPRVLELIAAAERAHPAPGPFRIHRMEGWQPFDWFIHSSESRFEEMVLWQRDTLVHFNGLVFGPHFTYVLGPTELLDYVLFFAPSTEQADLPTARAANLRPGDTYVYYPRRSFDLWNTRYFIVPARLDAADLRRGFASLLPDTQVLYPDLKSFEGPGGAERRARWYYEEDVSLLLNKRAFPRAWVVHRGKSIKPILGMNPLTRRPLLKHLMSRGADFDSAGEVDQGANDPHQMAWIETDHPAALARYVAGGEPQPTETVAVDTMESDRVVLSANLTSPGVVILADVFYPGWELTIDGRDAEILRVNRLMRGALVDIGRHRLAYTYRPRSFRWGMGISLSALLCVAVVLIVQAAQRRPA